MEIFPYIGLKDRPYIWVRYIQSSSVPVAWPLPNGDDQGQGRLKPHRPGGVRAAADEGSEEARQFHGQDPWAEFAGDGLGAGGMNTTLVMQDIHIQGTT